MIDEETLAGLLAEHAERIPVPETAVDSLLAASPPPLRPAPTRRSSFTTSLAVAASVVLAVGGVWAYAARSDNGTGSQVRAAAQTAPPGSTTTRPAVQLTGSESGKSRRQQSPTADRASPPPVAQRSVTTGAAALDLSPLGNLPWNFGESHVVRTATLDLRVAPSRLGETIGSVTTIAAAARGFVAEAHTAPPGTPAAGTVTIRVPAARYRATVEQLRRLGTVTGSGVRNIDLGRADAYRQRNLKGPANDTGYATITISVSAPDR